MCCPSGWPCARWRNLLMMHSLARPDRRAFLAALAAAPLAAAACGRRKYDPARFRRPEVSPVFLSAVDELCRRPERRRAARHARAGRRRRRQARAAQAQPRGIRARLGHQHPSLGHCRRGNRDAPGRRRRGRRRRGRRPSARHRVSAHRHRFVRSPARASHPLRRSQYGRCRVARAGEQLYRDRPDGTAGVRRSTRTWSCRCRS